MPGAYLKRHLCDFAQMRFNGPTPLGTMLERKVLQRHLYGPVRSGRFQKPIHIVVITDGEPTYEAPGQVRQAIKQAKAFLKSTRFGAGGVAFQFAQVQIHSSKSGSRLAPA